jgi:4-carboxymuconolactone decarboxylase
MSRIPYPDRDNLSEIKRAYLDAPDRRLLNVVRMAMHTPDGLWERQRDLATATVFDTTINPRLREVLILRVGAISRSDYELHHHRSIALRLGMDPAVIAAIESGDFAALEEEERVVAQFTTEIVEDVSPSDATLAAARALFSDATIFEMIAIIGVYMMTARIIGASGCEIDGVAISSWETEKAG